MAFDPTYKMSIQDINGNYYYATQSASDGSWTVATNPTLTFIDNLPDGWEDLTIQWARDSNYLGIFRSRSDSGFKFSGSARAIIQEIRKTQGIIGYGKLNIYIQQYDDTGITYPIYYNSEFDFASYSDNKLARQVSINTLDGMLYRLLESRGDAPFNIPIWLNTASVGDPPVWELNGDAEFVCHSGIKLLWNGAFLSGATPTSYIRPVDSAPTTLYGFNHGSVSDGRHWLPAMNTYNVTSNNGATTFIGNDILVNQLLQRDQSLNYEQVFWGTNDSRPYGRDQYLIKNLNGNPTNTIKVNVIVSGVMVNPITYDPGLIYTAPFIGFVLFEIDETDHPVMSGGNMQYIPLYKIYFPDNSGSFNFNPAGNGAFQSDPIEVTLKFNKCYVLGVIYDDDLIGISGHAVTSGPLLSALQIDFKSIYNQWPSDAPAIPAPQLNPTVFPAMRLYSLFRLLTSYLPTTNSDGYGFPTPVATDFAGKSDFLFAGVDGTPPITVKDVVPSQIWVTSAYCIHDLQGNPYITMTIKQLFNFCKKVLGCGMGIEYDTNGNPTILRIEDLGYFFDNTTMILDLGYDVTDLVIEQSQQNLGANLKLGYTKADTNTDFGVDSIATEIYFNTPATNIPGTMDYEESDFLVDQYPIEKIRAQTVAQPVGTSYDPANPSTDNQIVAIYCGNDDTQIALPNTGIYNFNPYDPSNNPVPCLAYTPVTFPTAQSTDPGAATSPYVFGAYYPDTYINLPLSPCRALQRGTGQLLHSVLDEMDSESLTFRKTGVMQYNNEVIDLSGMESNLVVGSGAGNVTTEFKDVVIGDLPPQLFKPIDIKFKSKYPINMYQILNNNPNGYIRFFWDNEDGFGYKEYKVFVNRVSQSAATNAPTSFEGWATPDMVI